MSDYRDAAERIIELAGGLDNIAAIQHCMTRLRMDVKDRGKVRDKEIKELKIVKGLIDANGQIQVILGTGIVNKVYKEVNAIFEQAGKKQEIKAQGGNWLQKISRLFGDIFIPIIPVIVASGVLMGVRTYLTSTGFLAADTAWFKIAAILIDTGFSILPALVCWSATKKFGGNPVFGFVLGMMLLSGNLPAAGAVGRGNAEPLLVELFGMQFKLIGYQGSVLIAVLGGWLLAKTENLVRKVVPNVIDMILTPILTLGICLFVILFGIGPVVQLFEGCLVQFFRMVLQLPLGLGGFITAALQQVLVITGMHHGLWIIDISFLEETGRNMYQPIRNAGMLGQAGACLAFALFAKDAKQKASSVAATTGALFGITEPAIFGTTLAYGYPFVFGMIGAGFAGMFAMITGLAAPGMGAGCIPGLLYYMDQGMELYLISSGIALVIPFVLTTFFMKKKHV